MSKYEAVLGWEVSSQTKNGLIKSFVRFGSPPIGGTCFPYQII